MKNKIYNLVSLSLVLCILINLFSSFKIVATEAEKKESKPLIIIDPGHGGEDGGTVAKDGTLEKDVNWDGTTNTVYIGKMPANKNQFSVDPSTLESFTDTNLLSVGSNYITGGIFNFYISQNATDEYMKMYADNYSKILFESDEKYYFDLVQKYKNDPRITFMSELWNEN